MTSPTPPPRDLPECPHYVAHPQAVWFEEHWRPAFEAVVKERDEFEAGMLSAIQELSKSDKERDALKKQVGDSRLYAQGLAAQLAEANNATEEMRKIGVRECNRIRHEMNTDGLEWAAQIGRLERALDEAKGWIERTGYNPIVIKRIERLERGE